MSTTERRNRLLGLDGQPVTLDQTVRRRVLVPFSEKDHRMLRKRAAELDMSPVNYLVYAAAVELGIRTQE